MAKREKYTTGKDGYKRYQITYVDATGTTRRKRLTARTDREMDNKINEFNRAIGRGAVGFDASTTLKEWSTYWLQAKKEGKVKKNTYKGYCQQIARLNAALGCRVVSSITPIELDHTMNSISGMSLSTIRKYRNVIKSVFSSAEKNGLISKSPAADLDLPSSTSGTHRPLTNEERLLCTKVAATHPFGLCVMLMLYAGLRRGEALYFNVDRDVDFSAKTLTVRGSYWFDGNKGEEGSTKSDAGMRTFSITPQLMPFLLAHRGHGAAFIPKHGGKVTSSAFRSAWNSFRTSVSDMQNGFTRRWPKKDSTGKPFPYIESDIRTHDFRHTFATLLYDADVDVKTAQYILGHSDITVTLRIYTHLSEIKSAKSIDKMLMHFEALDSQV